MGPLRRAVRAIIRNRRAAFLLKPAADCVARTCYLWCYRARARPVRRRLGFRPICHLRRLFKEAAVQVVGSRVDGLAACKSIGDCRRVTHSTFCAPFSLKLTLRIVRVDDIFYGCCDKSIAFVIPLQRTRGGQVEPTKERFFAPNQAGTHRRRRSQSLPQRQTLPKGPGPEIGGPKIVTPATQAPPSPK